jgi:hypothetical protein
MRLKERLERLRDRHALIQWTLACPECRKEFTAYGDIALEFLIAEWAKESGSEHDSPADMAAILEHEYDAWEFVDKRTGLPFLSREVSGTNLSPGETRIAP